VSLDTFGDHPLFNSAHTPGRAETAALVKASNVKEGRAAAAATFREIRQRKTAEAEAKAQHAADKAPRDAAECAARASEVLASAAAAWSQREEAASRRHASDRKKAAAARNASATSAAAAKKPDPKALAEARAKGLAEDAQALEEERAARDKRFAASRAAFVAKAEGAYNALAKKQDGQAAKDEAALKQAKGLAALKAREQAAAAYTAQVLGDASLTHAQAEALLEARKAEDAAAKDAAAKAAKAEKPTARARPALWSLPGAY
jgi:hypothetical protein